MLGFVWVQRKLTLMSIAAISIASVTVHLLAFSVFLSTPRLRPCARDSGQATSEARRYFSCKCFDRLTCIWRGRTGPMNRVAWAVHQDEAVRRATKFNMERCILGGWSCVSLGRVIFGCVNPRSAYWDDGRSFLDACSCCKSFATIVLLLVRLYDGTGRGEPA